MKPNFLIIGERRSGSTTLAKWVEAHPQIGMLPNMDTAYFMDNEIRGRMTWLDGFLDHENWYLNHSKKAYEQLFTNFDESGQIIGEKSADYFFLKQCIERIKRFYPDIKLVLILRNPVQRAWSHYINEVGKGRESLSFSEAIEIEDKRIGESEYALAHLSYKSRGFYADNLDILYEYFPKKQVHILILEEMIKDPQDELRKVYEYLEVDVNQGYSRIKINYNKNWTTFPKLFWRKNKLFSISEKAINYLIKITVSFLFRDIYKRRKISVKIQKITRYGKDEMQMDDNIKGKLIQIYAPHNKRLAKLISKDLSVWK